MGASLIASRLANCMPLQAEEAGPDQLVHVECLTVSGTRTELRASRACIPLCPCREAQRQAEQGRALFEPAGRVRADPA